MLRYGRRARIFLPHPRGDGAEGRQDGSPRKLEVAVDNQCSVENVTRFARNAGYQVTVSDFEGDFKLTLTK